jgi:hypothetical protein
MQSNPYDRFREYLLGGLSAGERTAIEVKYLESNEFSDEMEAVEEELIDSYLRGDLPEPDRARFEMRFLEVPELRRVVEQAKVIRDVLATPAAASQGQPFRRAPTSRKMRFTGRLAWGLTAAAVACAVCMAAVWQWQRSALQAELGEVRAQIEAERSRLEAAATTAQAAAHGYVETVASLTARSLRTSRSSATHNEVRIEPRTNLIRLRLPIREDLKYNSYRASLRSVDEEHSYPVWVQNGLTASQEETGRIVEVAFPRALVQARDYILALDGVTGRGFEGLDSYSFRIVEQ